MKHFCLSYLLYSCLVWCVYTEKIYTITMTKPILSTDLQLWRLEYRFMYCHAYKFFPVNTFPFPLTVNTFPSTLLACWQDFAVKSAWHIHNCSRYISHPSNDMFKTWTHQSAVKTWLTNLKWIPLICVHKIRILICNMRLVTLRNWTHRFLSKVSPVIWIGLTCIKGRYITKSASD